MVVVVGVVGVGGGWWGGGGGGVVWGGGGGAPPPGRGGCAGCFLCCVWGWGGVMFLLGEHNRQEISSFSLRPGGVWVVF